MLNQRVKKLTHWKFNQLLKETVSYVAQLVECLSQHHIKPCTEVYTFNSSTWEAKSEGQGYLWLHSEFDASPG